MARAVRTPRAPTEAQPQRRSHAGRIAAAALGVGTASAFGVGLTNTAPANPAASAQVSPDDAITPGAIDPTVQGATICKHDWAAGSPPTETGTSTYSVAARHTSTAVKKQAFANYGLTDPMDGGLTYEVDHRVPLSLGGRDVIQNLWPQTRDRALPMNAWVKDRLEFRLYNLLCHAKPGDPPITLEEAQQALLGSWIAAYNQYCENAQACPAYSGPDN